jgi:hypothetical protein
MKSLDMTKNISMTISTAGRGIKYMFVFIKSFSFTITVTSISVLYHILWIMKSKHSIFWLCGCLCGCDPLIFPVLSLPWFCPTCQMLWYDLWGLHTIRKFIISCRATQVWSCVQSISPTRLIIVCWWEVWKNSIIRQFLSVICVMVCVLFLFRGLNGQYSFLGNFMFLYI